MLYISIKKDTDEFLKRYGGISKKIRRNSPKDTEEFSTLYKALILKLL